MSDFFAWSGPGAVPGLAYWRRLRRAKRSAAALPEAWADELWALVLPLDASAGACVVASAQTERLLLSAPFLAALGRPSHVSTPPLQLDDLMSSADAALVRTGLSTARGQSSTSEVLQLKVTSLHGSAVTLRVSFAAAPHHPRRTALGIGLLTVAAEAPASNARALESSYLLERNQILERARRGREVADRIARHDLRSPLTSIVSLTGLLRQRAQLTIADLQLVHTIESGARRMVELLTMSIDLYQMELGSYKFVPQSIDLMRLAKTVVDELLVHAQSKSLQVVVERADAVLSEGDERLCYAILHNLLRNALDAAPEHSTVTLRAYRGSLSGIEIHNAGAIPAAIQSRFFQKFVSAGKPDGQGLGAYSARLRALAQKGELVMSTSEAQGTRLTLKLHRHRRRAHGDGTDPTPPGGIVGQVIDATALPARHEAADIASGHVAHVTRVLMVDDDADAHSVMRALLPPGVGFIAVVNGRIGVDAVERYAPDVVIMDLEMPVMGGLAAARILRAQAQEFPLRPRPLLIACSADDSDNTRQGAKEAGFDQMLGKPIDAATLAAVTRVDRTRSASVRDVWFEPATRTLTRDYRASRLALLDTLRQHLAAKDRPAFDQVAHQLCGSPGIHGMDFEFKVLADTVHRPLADPAELEACIVALEHLLSSAVQH